MAKKARTAPSWLEDANARKIWERLHQDLVAIRFLEATDHNALGRYCQYMAEWISHTRVIRKEGATYTKKASRSKLADRGLARLDGAKPEQSLTNLSERLDNGAPQPIERTKRT